MPRGQPAMGFSLLELVIALSLLMLITGLVGASFSPWLSFQQTQETEQRLAQQQALWLAWLERHASEAEADPGRAGVPLGDVWLADGTVLSDAAWVDRLGAALAATGPALVEDGFHQPWTLRISRGLSRDEHGVLLHYHVIALLSAGANGQVEAASRFDPETGALTLAGDDRGVVVDGWPIARHQLEQLELRLERASGAWQDWFRSRWEGDAERDPSIDYFAGPCPGDVLADAWDTASDALPADCGPGSDPAAAGVRLGLTSSELLDPTGAGLHFDANSIATRNPDHADPGQRNPPYSAIVSGALPGGVVVQRAVLGTL